LNQRERIVYSESYYPKDWTCKKCGGKISLWDLQANDGLCPYCDTDFYLGGKMLKPISKTTQEDPT